MDTSGEADRDKPAASPKRPASRIKVGLFTIALAFIVLLGTLLLFELAGQLYVYKEEVRLLRDPDHRMKPGGGRVELNPDNIRCIHDAGYFRPDDLNFIFLGDSFIFGSGLLYERTIPSQFERIARLNHPDKNINVANFGWISSCPLLSLRLLKDIGAKYHPKFVVLCVDMTDFQDEMVYKNLIEKPGIYRLIDCLPTTFLGIMIGLRKAGVSEQTWERLYGYPSNKFFMTSRPLAETRKYFTGIQRSIDATNDFCKSQLKAPFILIILPRNFQYSAHESPDCLEKSRYRYENLGPYVLEPFKYFEEIRAKVNYPVFSLLPYFQKTTVSPTCFKEDPHWNANGARVAAEAIYDCCLKCGCFN
jgi:hypothetical protein